jgi:hypothetical protein
MAISIFRARSPRGIEAAIPIPPFKMISGTSKNIPTLRAILSEAKSWYASTYPDDPIENYSFLDPKGNKVPAIYFVYACPTADSSSFLQLPRLDALGLHDQ